MARKDIEHSGIVVGVLGNKLDVQITSNSACSSCSAAKLCTASESKQKIITAYTDDNNIPSVGSQVIIFAHESLGMKAVFLAYVMPLILMVLSIVIANQLGTSEAVSGLVGIVALLPYFIILWLFRHKLDKEFTFKTKNQIM